MPRNNSKQRKAVRKANTRPYQESHNYCDICDRFTSLAFAEHDRRAGHVAPGRILADWTINENREIIAR